MKLNSEFWNERWLENDTQWDLGYPSPAIADFVHSLPDKSIRVLIPGCGNAYEAEYLHTNGFTNVFVVDYASEALRRFSERVPSFPKDHLLNSDFFELNAGKFDLVIEQTFFCAIDPSRREQYEDKMFALLNENGILAGLLFTQTHVQSTSTALSMNSVEGPNNGGPPFPGTKDEYEKLFSERFTIRHMHPCTNSIKPREGRELWIELIKKEG